MSILNEDLDKQIQSYQEKIRELENKKLEQDKKIKTLEELNAYIEKYTHEYSISLDELYESQSDSIEKWIISMSKQESDFAIYDSLQKHFQKTPAKPKKSQVNKPRLIIGQYKNPFTQESIEKIKRNPKKLDDWIEEYGLDTVQSWKV